MSIIVIIPQLYELFSVVLSWEGELMLSLRLSQQNTSNGHNIVVDRNISWSTPDYDNYININAINYFLSENSFGTFRSDLYLANLTLKCILLL